MLAPSVPHNEAERLESLYALNLLDRVAEERFDRLTRLAKRLFNVPVAKVTMVASDAVFAISCAGAAAAPVPRELSFCSHTILQDDILAVDDTLLDPRFQDSPYVLGEPHVRFYVGCPLALPNGIRIGALCLTDAVPRHFDAEDLKLLRDLATMVEQEMAAVQLATTDELTQLSNRRGFEMLSQQAINVCRRLGQPASLLFFDLNHFKAINDTHGHAEGDRALMVFAELLREVLRSSDLIGRLGGDEFVALLISSGVQETATALERLRSAVTARNAQDQRGYDICYSVGLVDFDPARHDTIDRMLAEGDAEMYRHKQALKAQATRP